MKLKSDFQSIFWLFCSRLEGLVTVERRVSQFFILVLGIAQRKNYIKFTNDYESPEWLRQLSPSDITPDDCGCCVLPLLPVAAKPDEMANRACGFYMLPSPPSRFLHAT